MLIAVASNLRRSKRTAGKQITDLDRRVRRLQKNPAPRRLAARAVTSNNLAQNAVTSVELSPAVTATITSAQATANGKNKITYSTAVPGSTANSVGDIWWQYDASNIIIGQWTGLGGTSWQANTIGNTVIANLDAGKITVGVLTGRQVTCNETVTTAFTSRTSIAQLLANGSISANYTYVDSINDLDFYTNITLNKLSDSGSITCEGTASGSLKTTRILPGFVTVVGGTSNTTLYPAEVVVVGGGSQRTLTSTGIQNPSDARLKENVASLSESLNFTEIVNNLRPVEFNYIKDENKEVRHGFIAQEMFDVYQRAAMQGGEDPQEKPWSVCIENLIPVMVGALQQSFARISDLEARLSALEN